MNRAIPTLALSVAEAAHAVGVSEETIRAMVRTGQIHAVPVGKKPGQGDLRIGVDELRRVFARPEGPT